MMECTDKHWRMFVRGITSKTVLYTEMAVDATLLHQDRYMDFTIGKDICEHPSVIQLGGSDPALLSRACTVINEFNCAAGAKLYQEINLNCGCPSARVAKRSFGARLMFDPDGVREATYAMSRASSVPVTVKCRLGADGKDSYKELCHFVSTVAAGGVSKFIVHARKCLLAGLTTKQNRDVPPLRYEVVHRLARDFPSLEFIINGGIRTLDQGIVHLHGRYSAAPSHAKGPCSAEPEPEPEPGAVISEVAPRLGSAPGREETMSSVFAEPVAAEAVVASVFSPASAPCGCDYPDETEGGEEEDEGGVLSALQTNSPRVTGSDTDTEPDLPPVHGAMIGRAAFSNPLLLARADSTFFGCKDPNLTRREILLRYIDYCETQVDEETGPSRRGTNGGIERVSSSSVLKPVSKLMNGLPGGGAYRAELSEAYLALLAESRRRDDTVGVKHNPSPRIVVRYLPPICPKILYNFCFTIKFKILNHSNPCSVCVSVCLSNQLERAMGRMRDDLLDLPVADHCRIDCWGRLTADDVHSDAPDR